MVAVVAATNSREIYINRSRGSASRRVETRSPIRTGQRRGLERKRHGAERAQKGGGTRNRQDNLEQERDNETYEGVLRAVRWTRVGLIQRHVPDAGEYMPEARRRGK